MYWTKIAQNGQNDHFGQNDLIPNRILVFARQRWTKMVHFGLTTSILVHLRPPTVPWPLLSSEKVFQTNFVILGCIIFSGGWTSSSEKPFFFGARKGVGRSVKKGGGLRQRPCAAPFPYQTLLFGSRGRKRREYRSFSCLSVH